MRASLNKNLSKSNKKFIKLRRYALRLDTRSKLLGLFLLCLQVNILVAQEADSTKKPAHLSGAVTVTNNGISLIPTFSLSKPAAIFNLSMGKKKLSFEPELRFSLQGKPWSFIFWWRYQLIHNNKWIVNIGTHPALNFMIERLAVNGAYIEKIIARRYLAGELSPNYLLTKNISVGMYYLYSRGLDNGTTRNTHFLTVNAGISNIGLPGRLVFKVVPQVYYLNLDRREGYYVTATATLTRKNFPLTIQSIVNKKIHTNIVASKNFVWNLSLIYSFNRKYVQQQ
jgi:hypothetical protein